MKIDHLYSPSTNAAFLKDVAYQNTPADLRPLSEDAFRLYFLENPPAGKERRSDSNGQPAWFEISPPSKEELGDIERSWRNSEIGLTDRVFVADYGPVGWSNEDRQTAHNTIIEYRRQLKEWPVHPEFPNSAHRPVWPATVPRPAV